MVDHSVEEVALNVGGQKIWPPLALAPMVGISHSAMRTLVGELGGVGLYFTEMLSAKRLPQENEKVSPLLVRSEEEYPLFYQIFMSDDVHVPAVVDRLWQLQAQGIDVNLGCPAPKLRKQGAGCFLTKKPDVVREIISSFKKLSPLPLTVKIRLGETLNEGRLVNFCSMLEDEGVDMVTVHGRLHGEKFCRKARWDWIGKVKTKVGIPVLANGGIFTVEDAKNCLDISGADGLMIGRGAALRPWIFAEIASAVYNCTNPDSQMTRQKIYFRFVELLCLRFKKERRLGRLKQFTHYFAGSYTFGHHLASMIQTSNSLEQAEDRARKFFARTNETLNFEV